MSSEHEQEDEGPPPPSPPSRKLTRAEMEAKFEAQRLRPKNTVFTNVSDAQQYLREVVAAHPLLLVSVDPVDCTCVYQYQRRPPEDSDIAQRLGNNDVVWLANWVFAWLDEKLLTSESRKGLESVIPRMRQGFHVQFVELVITIINEAHNIITNLDKINHCTQMLMCMTAVNEGSYDSLEHVLKLMKAEQRDDDDDHKFNAIVHDVSHALQIRGEETILRQLHDKGLLKSSPPPVCICIGDDDTTLKSITAQRLVEAMCHQMDTSKRRGVPCVKSMLQRLPTDVVRRYVVPHVPTNRSDMFSILYYDLRVISTETYLDSLMEARRRRNFVSFVRGQTLPYHNNQMRRFVVQVFGDDDDDTLPLTIKFVPREHSTVDHTHLHMYAEVNPRWTCKDVAELSKMRCIVSQEEFEMNFLALTGMDLRRMKLREHGFVIAGGSLVLSLLPLLPPDATLEQRRAYYHTHYPTADVDIFPYCERLTPISRPSLDFGVFTAFFEHLHKDVFDGEDMLVTSSRRLLTIVRRSTHVVIQIPYGDWHEPLDAVENADMDCAGVYYSDHTGVRMTLRAHLAFTHRMNIIRQDMWHSRGSPAYESRLCRYAKRGFSVVDGYIPNGEIVEFMDAEIDRWVTEHPKGEARCKIRDMLRGAIRVRAFHRNALPMETHYPSNMRFVVDGVEDNIQHVIDAVVGRAVQKRQPDVGEDDSYGIQATASRERRVNERTKITAMSLKWCATSQHHLADCHEATEASFRRTVSGAIYENRRVELEQCLVGPWQRSISFGLGIASDQVCDLLGKMKPQ